MPIVSSNVLLQKAVYESEEFSYVVMSIFFKCTMDTLRTQPLWKRRFKLKGNGLHSGLPSSAWGFLRPIAKSRAARIH